MVNMVSILGAGAAVVVAVVTLVSLIIKVWPKSLRPTVNKLHNNIDTIIAKQEEIKKDIVDLQTSLKNEVIRTDKEMERLIIKSDKLTDLMISLSRERYPYNNK